MTSPRVRILIPTSDRKRSGGTRAYRFMEAQHERSMNRFPSLITPRREAITAFLSALKVQGDAKRLLRKNGSLLEAATQRDRDFYKNPLMQVIDRECGPLFKALDDATLTREARRRLRESVILVCPLLGLLAPTDHVPEYLCPVGAQTRNGVKSLHHLWKPRVTSVLNRLCNKSTVISFLPTRIRALWDRAPSSSTLIQIGFARMSNGKLRYEHAGLGRLSGELLRHVLETGLTEPAELQRWASTAGHVFSSEHSKVSGLDRTIIFLRP